ncbi:RNA-dependent RNA polymerase 2 [Impatiens glandulifera]|uniref:RNA-dependent RNA polymerase 2 n=1 Tax=Impatiens glandulifera TaxID=253017 RepID=UPI001FB06F56|nr:RNA-dependent RNA polymerase 2 [Impatiens glandulifera]
MANRPTGTLRVSNIPKTAIAQDLFDFLESKIGKDSIFACEIITDHKNWKSRGFGRVQFETLAGKSAVELLSKEGNLIFKGSSLSVESTDDVIFRPVEALNRVENGRLHCGVLKKDDYMCVLENWEGVIGSFLPERRSLEFWVEYDGNSYKLEIPFDHVWESSVCRLDGGKSNAILFKLKHAPKIYQKFSGPGVTSKFATDRYHICKENVEFLWIRTTDFSGLKSIGQSSVLCWEIDEASTTTLDICKLPYFKNDLKDIVLKDSKELGSTSVLVPLVKSKQEFRLSYEVLFQLNSVIQMQKISLASVNDDLFEILSHLEEETAVTILRKMHKLHSTCYDPVSYIENRSSIVETNGNKNPSSNSNTMKCHRVLVTPSKIFCLGPELENSNYVVKKFSSNSSDFLRVTFVDEDWSKIHAYAISTNIQKGLFSKTYQTNIYHRILSILGDGIVIGEKRFEFLAFSASQLRNNSVWMFASNEKVKANDIREWMGCFEKIQSVSKCAARMGQLFSSSRQSFEVMAQDVETIPDIEVKTEGVSYCFSDGIGKISHLFARKVAQKCGLEHTPSAFQIRFGGYKGVIAVDRNSFRKLSLRNSMLKFESKNRMLNITKWSDSLPCYLNREIITLFSTLNVKDESLLAIQDRHLRLLDRMLNSRESALEMLESLGFGKDGKSIQMKMLVHGYEPNKEPYLSMLLSALHDSQLSEMRNRCRLHVPKGRLLVGCLDETGILEYGQVYVRITLNKTELRNGDNKYFKKLDDETAVLTCKVVVTKNPCLHPGDVRVLDAVFEVGLEEKGLVDCLLFPQNGARPHPNECSGGDLDGDLYFISWDETLIPPETVAPMDYTARRPRIIDHRVSMEEIQRFFMDYMINDSLGAISNAHLIHADREPMKALSPKCLELADLHSMAVDFAKTGAPAQMPNYLKPREFPDFMQRDDRPSYISQGVLGKLYRATKSSNLCKSWGPVWSKEIAEAAYDQSIVVSGYEDFIKTAEGHKEMYTDRMSALMNFYEAGSEVEILTGDLKMKSAYLQRDNRRYIEMRDRILVSVKSLNKEAKGWFEGGCKEWEQLKLASAWYHVAYHPDYWESSANCLGFPWIVCDILLDVE